MFSTTPLAGTPAFHCEGRAMTAARAAGVGVVAALVAGACDFTGTTFSGEETEPPFSLDCSIPTRDLVDGNVGVDGIPSLENPEYASVADADSDLLPDSMRVVGVELDGRPLAVPHNLLWYHEIVNIDLADGGSVAVTYSPLSGSPMAFERGSIDHDEFGVSGLLFRNNLVMYDRSEVESLWPQMARGARCGPRDGAMLSMVPVTDMTWEAWSRMYPDGEFVGFDTGHTVGGEEEPYRFYPYGDYESLSSERTLFPEVNPDRRRPLKERVLAIPPEGMPNWSGEGPAEGRAPVAYPFLELDGADGSVEVVHEEVHGDDVVILWDGEAEAARAYHRPELDGEPLTFQADGDRIVDGETGSEWRVDGLATDGELEGERLEPVVRAYISFWFAWTDFHPHTELWERDE